MDLIKTICLFALLSITMLLYTPFGLLLLVFKILGLKKIPDLCIYRMAQIWALMLIRGTGCQLTVTGREHIPKEGGVCFVSNHASIIDILLILAFVGRPVGFIAKKELTYVPLLNLWILLIGCLFIDRVSIRKAVKTIDEGAKKIKAGRAMLIFPEGHRSKGEGMLPFHAGSLKLATQALAPIIPVAIVGSYDIFERNYRVKAAPVSLSFCQPIITAELPPEVKRQHLSDLVAETIQAEIAALEQVRATAASA